MQSLNIQVKDMCKFSELIEHFQYHTEKYGDDVFTFFSKHYGELKDKHHDNHQKEDHNQLPFDHNFNLNLLSSFILQKVKFSLTEKTTYLQATNFHYFNNYTFIENSDIFQPPKKS